MLVLFWILFSIAVGIGANARGRSGLGWFLLSIVLSPLLAGFLVLALPARKQISTVRDDMELQRNIEGNTLAYKSSTPLRKLILVTGILLFVVMLVGALNPPAPINPVAPPVGASGR